MGWLLFFLTAVYAVESLLTMRASVLGFVSKGKKISLARAVYSYSC